MTNKFKAGDLVKLKSEFQHYMGWKKYYNKGYKIIHIHGYLLQLENLSDVPNWHYSYWEPANSFIIRERLGIK